MGGQGGHLEAKFGLGRLDLGVQGGQKLSFRKHQKTYGKSMFLAEFWRQRAFRKLAKWQFGGLVAALMFGREQLAGDVGFRMGLRVQI